MAKQSMKQQIYQSIANSQVKQVMAQKREQEIAQLQAQFNAWNKQQDEKAALQAAYDEWNAANPIEQPTVNQIKAENTTAQRIPSLADSQPKKREQTEMEKHIAEVTKQAKEKRLRERAQKLQQLEQIEASRRPEKTEKKADLEGYFRQQQEENMLASKKANNAEKWLSPDYKLTDKDKKAAKAYAQAELQKLDYDSNKKPILKTPEERQHYADMVNLLNKTNAFTNAMEGVIKQPAALGRAVRDAGRNVTNQITGLGAAFGDKFGLTEGATKRHNEKVAEKDAFYKQNDEAMRQALANAKTQNPIATTAGEIGGQVGMYMLTNPAFDALGATAGLGKAGSFALNQVGQNAQDLALDTIPMLNDYLEGGVSNEERKELLKNIGLNAAGNLAMGAAGEGISALAKNRAARKAADEAFRVNALEGADRLARLAGTEDIDNIVRSATRQSEEAAQNIDNLAKQIPEQQAEVIKKSMNKTPNNYPDGKLYMDDDDIADILVSGKRDNKKRLQAYNEGKKISIANRNELKEFLYGDNSNYFDTVTFGKVSDRLADEINQVSNGKFDDLYGAYLDIEKGHSGHSIDKHSIPKDPGDMPLDEESLLSALENTNNAKVLDTKKYNSGDRTVTLALPTTDGHVIMIETVSKSRGSLLYRNGWVVDNQKFIDKFLRSNPNSAEDISPTTVRDGIAPYKSNVTDAIENVNKNSINNIPSPEELKELEREASVMDGVEDISNAWKSNVAETVENTAKSQPNYDPEVQEKLLSDFEEIYRGMDNMNRAAINSGDAKAIEKFEKLQKAVFDYENTIWKNGDPSDINKAKKAADAARQGFIRQMKKIDPSYTGDLTGTKLGNAEYRIPKGVSDEEADELVRDWIDTDMSNPNRFVEDVSKRNNVNTSVPKNLEIQELYGKNGKPRYYVAEKISDTISRPVEPGKTYKTVDEANEAVYRLKNLEQEGSKSNVVMAEDTGLTPEPEGNKLTFDYEKPVGDTVPEYKITEELDTPDNLKERGQSKHIRNADTPMRMENVAEEVAADFEKDPDMYRVLRNADTKARAEEIYNTSDNPEAAFRALLDKKDPAALPLGHQLAKDYSAAGNHDMAAQIYRDMGKALTESGQFSQAAIINMVKNDPMTALQFAQKEIDSLNAAGVKRFGDKWKDFKLTDQEIDAFKNVKAGDSDAIKAIYKNIGDRLGKDYPTTLWEKLIEARRVAMLFNPRTNVRNVLANPPTLGMRWLSDRAEALGQNIAHFINPDIKVTQSLYGSGKKGRQLAKEVYNSPRVQALLEGSGSKADLPNLKNSLMENKQIFKGTPVGKWIDKVTGGGIQKANEVLFGKKGVQSVPETIRNATYKLLDLGDRPFVKENFVERLGSYIAATKIKNIDDIPDEAIEMAWEEAMKATYKDNSWAVDMIRGLKKGMEKADNFIPGLGTTLSQSTIPFVQAPGNIAARMVDYSPAGAGKGIAHIISGARKNNVKAVEKGIEEAAKGLTGSGLIYLGMKLKESGILTGTYSSDKDQKAFEKMNGFKEFALHVGDQYFTYGWAQPFAQELMVGTLLQDAIDKSDKYDSDILRYYGLEGSKAGKAIGVAKEGTKAAINSWFNESPLSGFADLLKGNSYEKTDIAGNLWDNGVSDFAGAMIPSVVNATAKVADTTQRNTYNPDNGYATFLNANIAKIPGLSKTLPAKYDTWGREMKYAETPGAAAAARYIIPGEYSYDKADEVDNEINRLFNEGVDSEGKLLQDNGVFPTVAPNKVGDKTLNNKEVSEYQKDMGQRSRIAVESFINSDAYKSMDDPEKVEVLKKIYGTSSALTKRDKFDTPLPDNSPYKKAVAAYDEAGKGEKGAAAIAEYYTNKTKADESGLSSQSDAYEEIQKDLANGNTKAAEQKIDTAKQLTDAGIGIDGYNVYKARKSSIPKLDDWITEYKSIDSLGNSDGFVNQKEFISAVKKNGWSEDEAVKYSKIYGNWKKIPYLKKDGTWGFHEAK